MLFSWTKNAGTPRKYGSTAQKSHTKVVRYLGTYLRSGGPNMLTVTTVYQEDSMKARKPGVN